MSIAEMKLAAIQTISKLEGEQELQEILDHLARLSAAAQEKELHLPQHYSKAKEPYGEVLKKLAQ